MDLSGQTDRTDLQRLPSVGPLVSKSSLITASELILPGLESGTLDFYTDSRYKEKLHKLLRLITSFLRLATSKDLYTVVSVIGSGAYGSIILP